MFELVFMSAMTPSLRSLIQDCFSTGKDKPASAEEASHFDVVFHGLIQRLEAEPDLVSLIVDKCEYGNGVQALSVLRQKFVGNTPAKSLTVLGEMFTLKLDSDTLSGAQQLLALNKQLARDEQFPDKLLSAFVFCASTEHALPAKGGV